MNWWLIITIPLLTAMAAWLSNTILVKMLFRPHNPIRVLGITIQGIFPARQPQLAQQLGKLVSNDLLSFNEIEAKITNEENIKKIMPLVEVHVDEFLNKRLGEAFPMIGMLIGERTIGTLKGIFMKELETIFPVVLKGYVHNLQKDLDLENLVTEKIAALSSQKLEAALFSGMKKELRMAGLFCGGVGLVVGLIQVGLMILLL